jgi:hypothetical protein
MAAPANKVIRIEPLPGFAVILPARGYFSQSPILTLSLPPVLRFKVSPIIWLRGGIFALIVLA